MRQVHPSTTVSLTASCRRVLDELVVAGPCQLELNQWIVVFDPIYATVTWGSGALTMSHTQENVLVLWGGWGRHASSVDVRARARVLERHVCFVWEASFKRRFHILTCWLVDIGAARIGWLRSVICGCFSIARHSILRSKLLVPKGELLCLGSQRQSHR